MTSSLDVWRWAECESTRRWVLQLWRLNFFKQSSRGRSCACVSGRTHRVPAEEDAQRDGQHDPRAPHGSSARVQQQPSPPLPPAVRRRVAPEGGLLLLLFLLPLRKPDWIYANRRPRLLKSQRGHVSGSEETRADWGAGAPASACASLHRDTGRTRAKVARTKTWREPRGRYRRSHALTRPSARGRADPQERSQLIISWAKRRALVRHADKSSPCWREATSLCDVL